MKYMIRKTKNHRFVVIQKDPNKKGFGSTKIIANVKTRAEADKIVKNGGKK